MYRQGDVLIIPTNSLPVALDPVLRENGRLVLAHGEATGHAHVVTAEGAALFRDPRLMAMFLKVNDKAVALQHEEHDTIILPPGDYRVVRQREYSPEKIRHVAD